MNISDKLKLNKKRRENHFITQIITHKLYIPLLNLEIEAQIFYRDSQHMHNKEVCTQRKIEGHVVFFSQLVCEKVRKWE